MLNIEYGAVVSSGFEGVRGVTLPTLLALAVAAFFAGAMDAIGGGGGLIMVPALLAAGLPPHLALGTNKGQSMFGSLAAAVRYALLGLSMARASADAKVASFASNVAAAAIFAHRGVIVWSIALPLALGQILGGFVGAHLAVRRGDPFVRAVVLAVVLALVLKIAHDLYPGP